MLPAKIFKIKEEINSGLLAQKLKDFHEKQSYQTKNGRTMDLVTEILDVEPSVELVSGVFAQDFVTKSNYRRELIEDLVTKEAPFHIGVLKGKSLLIALAPSGGGKKLLADNIANKLSNILFLRSGVIVEATISHETLKELHESNLQGTKLIWFDDVDLPGVEKLCLAGSDIVDTRLYQNYLEHAKMSYVVFEAQKRGIVVGIARNCVVTLFSKSTPQEFIDYIAEDLLSFIE